MEGTRRKAVPSSRFDSGRELWNDEMESRKILRITRVSDDTGLRPSTIYQKVREGVFPKPIKLTKRSSGWYSDEQAWIDGRPRA